MIIDIPQSMLLGNDLGTFVTLFIRQPKEDQNTAIENTVEKIALYKNEGKLNLAGPLELNLQNVQLYLNN